MKKIASLFQRNYDGDRLVRDEVVPGSEWVLAGEGTATRKFDGTSCMRKDGKWFKRYDVKKGRKCPADFIAAQDPDPVTGHWPGWVPVGEGPEDKYHREALAGAFILPAEMRRVDAAGTFELCGPMIQGNPEKLDVHMLIQHGAHPCETPRTFEGLREYLTTHDIEGIVWHHSDGRMVKIKTKDFGLKRSK